MLDSELLDLELDLPDDLPMFPIEDDFLDDYLGALGSSLLPSSSQDSANLLDHLQDELFPRLAPQDSGEGATMPVTS